MTNRIISLKEFDPTKVQIGELKLLDNGCKMSNMTYDGDLLTIEFPEMYSPWGFNELIPKEGGPAKFSMGVSFKGMGTRPALKKFHDDMNTLDDMVKKVAMDRSFDWFGGKKSAEVVEEKFKHTVRIPIDKDTKLPTDRFPPTMSVKMPFDVKRDQFTFECYDKNGNPIDIRHVPNKAKDAKVTIAAQCTGIWLAAGMFGVSWKVYMMVVVPAPKMTGFKAFKFADRIDDGRESEEAGEDVPKASYGQDDYDDVSSDGHSVPVVSTSVPDEDENLEEDTIVIPKKNLKPKPREE